MSCAACSTWTRRRNPRPSQSLDAWSRRWRRRSTTSPRPPRVLLVDHSTPCLYRLVDFFPPPSRTLSGPLYHMLVQVSWLLLSSPPSRTLSGYLSYIFIYPSISLSIYLYTYLSINLFNLSVKEHGESSGNGRSISISQPSRHTFDSFFEVGQL